MWKMNIFFTIMLLQLKAAEWITEISPVNGRFTRQGAGQGGNWRGAWGRMDACVCVAEFLHCPPGTIATLFINVILLLLRRGVCLENLVRSQISITAAWFQGVWEPNTGLEGFWLSIVARSVLVINCCQTIHSKLLGSKQRLR